MTSNIQNELCPVCNSDQFNVSRTTESTSLFGLDSVEVRNALHYECQDCGERIVSFPNHKPMLREVARRLALLGRALTAREFAFLRGFLGYSQQGLATLLNTTNVTLCRWETGVSAIDRCAEKLIRLLVLEKYGDKPAVRAALECFAEEGRATDVVIDMDDFRGADYVVHIRNEFGTKKRANGWKVITQAESLDVEEIAASL